jgi:SMI1-KNR4 cell-wall
METTQNMKLSRNFFRQPALGFDMYTQGRSDQQIEEFEAKVGFKLPESYCELMRQQNGGSLQYEKIIGIDGFGFSGGFAQLCPELAHYVSNFKDYILLSCYPEELEAAQKELAPFHPERLVLFSGLDGHSGAYFDFGYRQNEVRINPSIVFIGDDGDEFLHFCEIGPKFESFDDFLQNLAIETVVIEVKKSWFPMQKPIAGLKSKLLQIEGITGVVTLP